MLLILDLVLKNIKKKCLIIVVIVPREEGVVYSVALVLARYPRRHRNCPGVEVVPEINHVEGCLTAVGCKGLAIVCFIGSSQELYGSRGCP